MARWVDDQGCCIVCGDWSRDCVCLLCEYCDRPQSVTDSHPQCRPCGAWVCDGCRLPGDGSCPICSPSAMEELASGYGFVITGGGE